MRAWARGTTGCGTIAPASIADFSAAWTRPRTYNPACQPQIRQATAAIHADDPDMRDTRALCPAVATRPDRRIRIIGRQAGSAAEHDVSAGRCGDGRESASGQHDCQWA